LGDYRMVYFWPQFPDPGLSAFPQPGPNCRGQPLPVHPHRNLPSPCHPVVFLLGAGWAYSPNARRESQAVDDVLIGHSDGDPPVRPHPGIAARPAPFSL